MSNILEQEDIVKGLPDAALDSEMQQPSGQLPQFLILSEIHRRTEMRNNFAANEDDFSTPVVDQMLAASSASRQGLGTPMAQPSAMGQPSPMDQASPVPSMPSPSPAIPAGGVPQGLGGMGVQLASTGGVVGMAEAGRVYGPSNMVDAVDAAINMLRAEGRDASVYSQAELRRMGEEILGTTTGLTLEQQGYKRTRPELGFDGPELDRVSSFNAAMPSSNPLPYVLDAAGEAVDYVGDKAGDVADYFREDETLMALGDVMGGAYGATKDAIGGGFDYLGDKYDSVRDAYNSSWLGTPLDETYPALQGLTNIFKDSTSALPYGYNVLRMGDPANVVGELMLNGPRGEETPAERNERINSGPLIGAGGEIIEDVSKQGSVVIDGERGTLEEGIYADLPAWAIGDAPPVETAILDTAYRPEISGAQSSQDRMRQDAAFLSGNQRDPQFMYGKLDEDDASFSILGDLGDEVDLLRSGQASELESLESLIESTRANAKKQAFYLGMMALGAGISKGEMGEGMERATEVAGETLARGEGAAVPLEAAMISAPRQGARDRIDALAAMARADSQYLAIEERALAQGHMSERNRNDLVRAALPLAQQVLEDAGVYPDDPTYTEVFNNLMTQYMDYANLGAPLNNRGPRDRDLTSFDSPE